MSQLTFSTFLLAALGTVPCAVQGGNVNVAAGTATDPQLDPDGDGFITVSGGALTSVTTERSEFEAPTDLVGDWVEIFDVAEANGDVNPICSASDITPDGDGGNAGYWDLTDPTPLAPRSGDEHLVLRMRVADEPQGNAGFSFVLSTDGLYGAGVDPNAVAGNQGFQYEILFTSGGGGKGVSG